MAKLREVKRMSRRRLVDDMPRRNDLLLTNPEIVTGIMRKIRPSSPAVFFPSFLGNQVGADESMFEAAPQGLGVGFIRLKEYKEVYEPVRVTGNTLVPATITAHVPFELSTDYPLEADENFLAKDEKSYFRVISARTAPGGKHDITVVYDNQPGATCSGSLFGVGDPINYNYGNSKGEGSTDSNTFMGDSLQYNTFFNPMKITRRVFTQTGSAMADESEYFTFTLEEEQGVFKDYYTDIPISFFEKIVREMSNQFMYSTANFDPTTRRIHGLSSKGKYAERPSYAGIYQQLDEVKMVFNHLIRSQNNFQLLTTIDEILRMMYYANGGQQVKLFACGKGAGIAVLRDAFRWALTNKFGVGIKIDTPTGTGKFDVGFEIGSYVTDYGTLMLYDMGIGMYKDGEFEKTTYGNLSGNPRDWEIYFMPAMSRAANGAMKKPVSVYYRQSKRDGKNISRGLVFGTVSGLTGQGNGMTFEQLQSMQEAGIRQMLESQSYQIGSTFDGKESHVLYESVPYIDIDKIIKLQLIP